MEPGTKLGPYEITEQLGSGGMGEVYLAQDTRLGRKVAIKVLPAEFASDPERLARFEQEARAAAALNHPHIAAVFDVGTEGDTDFMVQEYLEGDTLREPLQKGALPLKKSLGLATEIAEALAAARASCSKRARRSGSEANSAGSTLMATLRRRRVSSPRYTSPMPPAPSGSRIS